MKLFRPLVTIVRARWVSVLVILAALCSILIVGFILGLRRDVPVINSQHHLPQRPFPSDEAFVAFDFPGVAVRSRRYLTNEIKWKLTATPLENLDGTPPKVPYHGIGH